MLAVVLAQPRRHPRTTPAEDQTPSAPGPAAAGAEPFSASLGISLVKSPTASDEQIAYFAFRYSLPDEQTVTSIRTSRVPLNTAAGAGGLGMGSTACMRDRSLISS